MQILIMAGLQLALCPHFMALQSQRCHDPVRGGGGGGGGICATHSAKNCQPAKKYACSTQVSNPQQEPGFSRLGDLLQGPHFEGIACAGGAE